MFLYFFAEGLGKMGGPVISCDFIILKNIEITVNLLLVLIIIFDISIILTNNKLPNHLCTIKSY